MREEEGSAGAGTAAARPTRPDRRWPPGSPGHVGADGDEEHVGAKVHHPLPDLAQVHAHAGGVGGSRGARAAGAGGAAGGRGACARAARAVCSTSSRGGAVRRRSNNSVLWAEQQGRAQASAAGPSGAQRAPQHAPDAKPGSAAKSAALAGSDTRPTVVEGLAAGEVTVVVHHHARGVQLHVGVHAAPHGQQLQRGKQALQASRCGGMGHVMICRPGRRRPAIRHRVWTGEGL